MKKLIVLLALACCLLPVAPVAAQEPTPDPGFEMPYNFDPVDYESGDQNPVATTITDMVADVSFINRIGSLAATLWSMLDNFAGGGVLGYFLVIVMALWVIRWLAGFVFNKPVMNDKIDLSTGAEIVGDVDPTRGTQARRAVRLLKNRPRF